MENIPPGGTPAKKPNAYGVKGFILLPHRSYSPSQNIVIEIQKKCTVTLWEKDNSLVE